MAIQTAAGASFAIATTSGVATVDLAGFGAKTYVTLGETTDIPQFGDEYGTVTHSPLAEGRVIKLKTIADAGSTSINFARDFTDAGQVKAEDALGGVDRFKDWAFRITAQDGTIIYFAGKVTSLTTTFGSAGDIVKGMANIVINSAVIR
jgi:hypothetical protein